MDSSWLGGKEGIRRVGRQRCITTLSPDVTRNELGTLPLQMSHRLKLSSPAIDPQAMGAAGFTAGFVSRSMVT